MPGFLFTTAARWIGVFLLVLATVAGIYYKGRLDERKLFNAYKAEVKAAALAQEEKTKQIEAKNQRLLEETKNAYNNKLTALRAYYSMRISGQGGSGLSQIPITAGGAIGSTPNDLPPIPTVIAQCAETTLTLVSLQEWVKNVAYNME